MFLNCVLRPFFTFGIFKCNKWFVKEIIMRKPASATRRWAHLATDIDISVHLAFRSRKHPLVKNGSFHESNASTRSGIRHWRISFNPVPITHTNSCFPIRDNDNDNSFNPFQLNLSPNFLPKMLAVILIYSISGRTAALDEKTQFFSIPVGISKTI